MTASTLILRCATRGSALALAQGALATTALQAVDPRVEVPVLEITTQGDRDRVTPLTVLGGQGIFAAAVREAVLDGRAAVAVRRYCPSTASACHMRDATMPPGVGAKGLSRRSSVTLIVSRNCGA